MQEDTFSLPSNGVLAGVSPASREALTGFGDFMTRLKGSVVVEQGGPANALHLVVDGELSVVLRTPEELVPLGYVQVGETVGEMGFLDQEAIASAAVTAHVPSVVWSITTDAFEAFLASHPVAGTEILKAILKLVGRRARKGNERLADEVAEA
ncbi:MAG TPA: cyclic nucleotide-binding domain-containing protein [Verrucomicrobiales bacterium]|jgi:CRP-like cAMP-binding protein|nr:cyclic nucleotide-binding domain-containing protein [Verrucomicrobiales bacterium]